MNTAREPKQEDRNDADALGSRRGMSLVRGGRKVSKPVRIAIADDLFSTEPHSPARDELRLGKNIRGVIDDSTTNGRGVGLGQRSDRASGSRALAIALAVTASGFLLKYLRGDRRKN